MLLSPIYSLYILLVLSKAGLVCVQLPNPPVVVWINSQLVTLCSLVQFPNPELLCPLLCAHRCVPNWPIEEKPSLCVGDTNKTDSWNLYWCQIAFWGTVQYLCVAGYKTIQFTWRSPQQVGDDLFQGKETPVWNWRCSGAGPFRLVRDALICPNSWPD